MYPDEVEQMPRQLALEKPFLRIDNHCIALWRVVTVDFIPDAVLWKIDKTYFYNEQSANSAAQSSKTFEEIHAPVILVKFINASGMTELIRRHGEEAKKVWQYVHANLASP